jgi:hypothetical protein
VVPGDEYASVAIDYDGDGKPDLGVGARGKQNALQSEDKSALNYVAPGSDPLTDLITNVDLSGSGHAELNLDPAGATQTYTDRALTPVVTVGVGGTTLVAGQDYTVVYANNVNPGNATVTVIGIGAYTGFKGASFTIGKASIASVSVAVSAGYAWSGKQLKPKPTVTFNGVRLTTADYSLSYGANKNIGKGTVKLTAKGAKFTGSKTVSIKVVPKANKVSKATSGKKQVKVSWSKVANKHPKVTKYQIRYRVKGTSAWKTKAFAAKSASATLKKLAKGKVYQFQVRSYKTVSKVKYYSAWSATKASKKVK